MSWLADRPMWLLMVVFIGGLAGVVWLGHRAASLLFGADTSSAVSVAPPLMPALGTAFAVLAAFAVASAATGLRDAETAVSDEANSAARLAWAISSVGPESSVLRSELQTYLDTTLATEWRRIDQISAGQGGAMASLTALERSVRSLAASEQLGTPQRSELLGAIDDIAAARRTRFATATPVAGGVVVLLVLSAVALVLNATVLLLDRRRRVGAMLAGLVVVTGLSISMVITLGAPFSGSFGAAARPLAGVADDLRSGVFELP
jgi:hypothetical protein